MNIAFSVESPVGTPVSDEAKQAVHRTVKWLEAQGHRVEEQANGVDGLRLMENYYLMNSGEISAMILGMEKTLGRRSLFRMLKLSHGCLMKQAKSVGSRIYGKPCFLGSSSCTNGGVS